MSTITLQEVKAHLRITNDDDNESLTQKIAAAEEHVAAYIGGPLVVDGKMPAGIREAILQQTEYFFDDKPVDLAGLLAPYRAWAF